MIRGSKFNKWYGKIKGEGVPGYLRKGWGESRWQRVARFRLRNEMRGNRYWKDGRERLCRICGGILKRMEKTWKHIGKESMS